jgi:hypothetical protein
MAEPKTDHDIEIVPNAWASFDRAVDVVVKGGPQHRSKKPSTAVDLAIADRSRVIYEFYEEDNGDVIISDHYLLSRDGIKRGLSEVLPRNLGKKN